MTTKFLALIFLLITSACSSTGGSTFVSDGRVFKEKNAMANINATWERKWQDNRGYLTGKKTDRPLKLTRIVLPEPIVGPQTAKERLQISFVMEISSQGRIIAFQFDPSDPPAYVAEIRRALSQWELEPITVGGAPKSWTVGYTWVFHPYPYSP